MKFNKEEYENIKIPEQLNSIVQDAIEEGLTTESTGMSDQKPVNIRLQRQLPIRRLSVLCVRYLPSGNMNMRMKPNM